MFQAEGLPNGILIVKAGPSKTDEGTIFTSKSGHLLRKWTSSFTEPVVFDYFSYEPAYKNCFSGNGLTKIGEVWKQNFLNRLKLHKPKVIVLLGRELLPIFTKRYSLEDTHCYVLRQTELGIPIIPCYPVEDCYIPQFGPDDEESLLSGSENTNVACERQFWIKCALAKAQKIITEVRSYPDFYIDNNWTRLEKYFQKALASPKVCLDIETVDKPNWVLSAFSMSIDSKSALAITPDIGQIQWEKALGYLRQILLNPAIEKVGQNWMGFDQTVLMARYRMQFAGKLWETMSSFSLLFPDFKRGLGEQARMLLDVAPWKGYHNSHGTELRLYAAQDTLYTMRLQEEHEKLLAEFDQLDHFREFIQPMETHAFKLQQNGLLVDRVYQAKIAEQIKESLTKVAADLGAFADDKVSMGERKASPRDNAKDVKLNFKTPLPELSVCQKWNRTQVNDFLRAALQLPDKALKEIYLAKKQDATRYGLEAGQFYRKSYRTETTFVKRAFNANSSHQLKSVFAFLKIKLPKVKKSKGVWGESTNIKSLLKMCRDGTVKGDSEKFVRLLLRYRKLEKLRAMYIDCTLDIDDRWRCSYSVSGAGTGRSSSRQTAFETGGNIQNFPRGTFEGIKIKSMFIADPGKVLVQRDQSQAEARLVAYLGGCSKLIELIETKQDMHVYSINGALGEDITKYKESDPKKYSFLRNLGKTKNFAGMYGTGAHTLFEIFLKDEVDVSLDMCKMLLAKHKETFPEIFTVFQQDVIDQLNTSRTLVTPFGRKRRFFGPLDDNTYRKAFAHVPQSTVPYLTNLQWRWLDGYALAHPEMEIQVLSMIHDALLWQMKPEYVKVCELAFNAYSEAQVLNVNGYKVVMPWDISTGLNWGKLS